MAKAAAKESKEKGEEKDGVEAEEGDEKTKKKKPWLMIGVIAVSSILVLSAIIGGTVYFMGRGTHKAPAASAKAKEAKAAEADAESADPADAAAEGDEEKSGKPAPANYVSLEPPFVVNFEGNSAARFLQINVEVMSRKVEYAEHIKKHMPVIRNNLVLLFGSQTYDKVSTLKGKEELRQKALAEVQKILEEETGDAGVEALYFTSFVMQ
jgi:flagellar FliL protein